jgi:hypothetical protein
MTQLVSDILSIIFSIDGLLRDENLFFKVIEKIP